MGSRAYAHLSDPGELRNIVDDEQASVVIRRHGARSIRGDRDVVGSAGDFESAREEYVDLMRRRLERVLG